MRLSGLASAFTCCGALLPALFSFTWRRRGVDGWGRGLRCPGAPILAAPCAQAMAPTFSGHLPDGGEGRPASGYGSRRARPPPPSAAPGPLPTFTCPPQVSFVSASEGEGPLGAKQIAGKHQDGLHPGNVPSVRAGTLAPRRPFPGAPGVLAGGHVPRQQEAASPRPAGQERPGPALGLEQGQPPWAPSGKWASYCISPQRSHHLCQLHHNVRHH